VQDFEDILPRLEKIHTDYCRLCDMLTFEEVLVDKKLFLAFERRKREVETIANTFEKYLELKQQIEELHTIMQTLNNSDEKDVFAIELENSQKELASYKSKLLSLLIGLDAITQNVIIQVVAMKGELSNTLKNILLKAYSLIAFKNDLTCKQIDDSSGSRLEISGINAREYFLQEVGVHEMTQTGKSGTAQVFVFENNLNVIGFDEKDVEITTCRATGAGGQHVNTTDSVIKATHIPTGISTISMDERSQFQNREKALDRLKQKVREYANKQYKSYIDKQKKEQLKKMKNVIVKLYDFDKEEIVFNKEIISLKDFIEGKIL
jgi:peptide chain release factor 1